MSRIVFVFAVLALVAFIAVPQASAGTEKGNAYNYNWLRDADGDGIPNGLDDDWTRPLDGTGHQLKYGFGLLLSGFGWGNAEDGNMYRNQNRHQKNQSDTECDRVRERKQLRDGSCQ
jgi:hypothetical protein